MQLPVGSLGSLAVALAPPTNELGSRTSAVGDGPALEPASPATLAEIVGVRQGALSAARPVALGTLETLVLVPLVALATVPLVPRVAKLATAKTAATFAYE